MKDIANILIKHPLFSKFDLWELEDLLDSSGVNVKVYNKGSYLHAEGETCDYMDIIIDGEVEVQKIDESGNLLTVTNFYPLSSLGENLLFGDENIYPMNAICSDITTVVHLSKSAILDLCKKDDNFLLKLLNDISNKALILTNKIKMISYKSLRERIIDYLRRESSIQKSSTITLRISKKELAQLLGVQRTSLSRELAKMRDEDILDFSRNRIRIKKEI